MFELCRPPSCKSEKTGVRPPTTVNPDDPEARNAKVCHNVDYLDYSNSG